MERLGEFKTADEAEKAADILENALTETAGTV